MSRRRWLAVLLPSLGILGSLASGAPKPSDSQNEQIAAAISLTTAGVSSEVGALMSQTFHDKRILVGDVPGEKGGVTDNVAGSDPARTNNSQTTVGKGNFEPPPIQDPTTGFDFRCSERFIDLTTTLYHEMTHQLQHRPGGDTIEELKIERAKLEKPAYKAGLKVLEAWEDAI